MLCSISIESHATEVAGNVQTVSFSVNKSKSNLSYRSCNYGEIEFSTTETDHSETGQLGATEDYFFHYYDHIRNFFTTNKNVYAYQIRLDISNTVFNGSNILQQSYAFGPWDQIQAGNASVISSSKNNSGFVIWVVTNYSEVSYYFGLLSYCHYKYNYLSSSTGNPWVDYFYASYNLKADLKFTITPYTETGYYKAIADNTKETNKKLDEANKIAQDTNETTKGIFSSIKDFFGSFFQNLINAVVSLFVPSAEEMGGLFDQLNQFFSDRFGFLYAPFDYMIRLMNVFLSSTGTTGITLPGFSIMGYEVWSDQTYDLSSDPLVGTILGYVRIGTGILLSGYFIMFLQNFFKERFGSG